MNEKEKQLLKLRFPDKPEEDDEYLLNPEITTEEKLKEEERLRELKQEPHPLVKEAKEKLRTAIEASSGARKIIEQLYGKGADVRIAPHEKDVQRAIRQVFKTNKSVITFEMYKEALAQVRNVAEKIKENVINEQSK